MIVLSADAMLPWSDWVAPSALGTKVKPASLHRPFDTRTMPMARSVERLTMPKGNHRLICVYDHAVPVSKKEESPLATPK